MYHVKLLEKGQSMDYLKEAEKYEKKAEAQYLDYQTNGSPSTLRSYERNRDIAHAFRLAASGSLIEQDLSNIKARLMCINTEDEPQNVISAVKRLQEYINQ